MTTDAKAFIVYDRETDGRWIAEVPTMQGVMAYGHTKREAAENVCELVLYRVLFPND